MCFIGNDTAGRRLLLTCCDSSGGPKAWKEMRQRQMEFYQGWDQDEAKTKKSDDDGNDGKLEEEFEGDDTGGGAAEEQEVQAKKEADEAAEDESEPVSRSLLFGTCSICTDTCYCRNSI